MSKKMVIEDYRSPDEIRRTIGFVVADTEWFSWTTDSDRNQDRTADRVAVAAAFTTKRNANKIVKKLRKRDDLERIRIVKGVKKKNGRYYTTRNKDRVYIHALDSFL